MKHAGVKIGASVNHFQQIMMHSFLLLQLNLELQWNWSGFAEKHFNIGPKMLSNNQRFYEELSWIVVFNRKLIYHTIALVEMLYTVHFRLLFCWGQAWSTTCFLPVAPVYLSKTGGPDVLLSFALNSPQEWVLFGINVFGLLLPGPCSLELHLTQLQALLEPLAYGTCSRNTANPRTVRNFSSMVSCGSKETLKGEQRRWACRKLRTDFNKGTRFHALLLCKNILSGVKFIFRPAGRRTVRANCPTARKFLAWLETCKQPRNEDGHGACWWGGDSSWVEWWYKTRDTSSNRTEALATRLLSFMRGDEQ